jgi:hypothetical protein
MSKEKHTGGFYFHKPGHYRIRVFGALGARWSNKLGGLRFTTEDSRDYGVLTTIEGEMRDQAELSGVLNTLYEHHFTLLSVQYLKSETSKEP